MASLCIVMAGGHAVAAEPVVAPATKDAAAAAPAATSATTVSATGYAGSTSCKPCHAAEYAAWASSMHAGAMKPAAEGATASQSRATFGKDGASGFDMSLEGGGRKVAVREGEQPVRTYDVPYLLGTRTMEQYLVAAEKGRLQAAPVAFDVARREWFDVFSGEERFPGEFGHWTGRGMNANSQCIECHATGYRKGYDSATGAYSSTWDEAGVGCESCHGPGVKHVADPKASYGPFGKSAGIAAFRPTPAHSSGDTASATSPDAAALPTAAPAMLDTCASCHSVRRPIADGFAAGAKLLDYYEPSLLDEDLYWPDGSVRTESYEWGSFVQSRMHAAGVNCLACHDVHSGELRAKGNELCLSCHEPALATRSHTAHAEGTPASECVSCHMPESVFMARDRRRDHALAIPDPLLARETGSPSACESCHAGRSRDVLATDAERLWPRLKDERFARRRSVAKAFADARGGRAGSAEAIRECLAGRLCDTAILRASAARLSVQFPLSEDMSGALRQALADPDPLVRSAAAYALADADPREPMLWQSLSAAATDPVRAVRVNAAWALRSLETDRLPQAESEPLHRAFNEWRTSAMALSEAPESWHTLGLFESARNDGKAAEAAYRSAIALEPQATPSRHNLAMLLAAEGRVDEARREFESLVAIDDSQAAAWYALGVLRSEQKDWREAAKALGRCLKLDPAYPGALTDLTQAYLEAGVPNVARAVLRGALEHAAVRREALVGMLVVALKAGTPEEATAAARALAAEDPSAAGDPEIARLLAGPSAQAGPAATAQ